MGGEVQQSQLLLVAQFLCRVGGGRARTQYACSSVSLRVGQDVGCSSGPVVVWVLCMVVGTSGTDPVWLWCGKGRARPPVLAGQKGGRHKWHLSALSPTIRMRSQKRCLSAVLSVDEVTATSRLSGSHFRIIKWGFLTYGPFSVDCFCTGSQGEWVCM